MSTEIEQRITRILIESIQTQFTDPELDTETGEIKLIDRDDSRIYLGHFEFDPDTDDLRSEPSSVWTIEVSTGSVESRS